MIMKIRNEQEYENALDDIEDLMDLDPHPDSYDGKVLDELVGAVEYYERRQYPWTMGVDEWDYLD